MIPLLLACVAHHATPPVADGYVPALGGLTSEVVAEGPLSARLATADGADLVLIYGGEEQGSLEPCGCPSRPRGGLARQAAYARAARAAAPDVPLAVVDGGAWLDDAMSLDGSPRADAPVINRWMLTGFAALGPAALNVGIPDVVGLSSLDDDLPATLPLVSANVRGPGVAPFVAIQVQTADGPLRLGITGITRPGPTLAPTPGFGVGDPVREGAAVLATLGPQVDLVVLLAYAAPDEARTLALDPEVGRWVDVVVDTNLHYADYEPFRVGEAIWVRTHLETMRLGELRLGLDRAPEEEGGQVRIAWARERRIDLDEALPDATDLAEITARAREEIDAAQAAVFGPGAP